ncbi:uncharacterized protein METZ01_LOCUS277126, partial [marine metagenome]
MATFPNVRLGTAPWAVGPVVSGMVLLFGGCLHMIVFILHPMHEGTVIAG